MNDIISQRARFDGFSAVGLEVQHKKLGAEKAVIHDVTIVEEEFTESIKRIQLPAEFLKTELDEIMALFTEMAALDMEIREKKSKINTAEIEIA